MISPRHLQLQMLARVLPPFFFFVFFFGFGFVLLRLPGTQLLLRENVGLLVSLVSSYLLSLRTSLPRSSIRGAAGPVRALPAPHPLFSPSLLPPFHPPPPPFSAQRRATSHRQPWITPATTWRCDFFFSKSALKVAHHAFFLALRFPFSQPVEC